MLTSTAATSSSVQTNTVDSCLLMDMLNQLNEGSRLPVLSELFSTCVSSLFKVLVPDDFLCLAASAMVQLSNGGRTNILYNLAKGMGTLRPGNDESRFPINKIPMGLVEYTALFFAFDNLQQVKQMKAACCLVIYLDILSSGLSPVATDNVFKFWREVGQVTSWTNVVFSWVSSGIGFPTFQYATESKHHGRMSPVYIPYNM